MTIYRRYQKRKDYVQFVNEIQLIQMQTENKSNNENEALKKTKNANNRIKKSQEK